MDVITIKNLSKKYTINSQKTFYKKSLQKDLASLFMNPFSFGKSKKEEFWALENINLTVKRGEVVSIIGPNGAGKSTLLKLVAGITRPTEGEIRIQGRISSLLSMGVGFHPELTGRENIFLDAAVLGIDPSEINKELDSIISFSGIGKFIDTPLKFYSSGMYMRLAFSVATSKSINPDILILDEVLAVGDAHFYKKSFQRLRHLIDENQTTVIFVSHNQKTIKQLSTSCVYIDQGKLIDQGTPKKVLVKYFKMQKKFNTQNI